MTKNTPAIVLVCLYGLAMPAFGQTADGETGPSIGMVLSGGGSFGAFQAGALQAYFERWGREHTGAPPPIRVIAGTSTGALLAPFVALGAAGVSEAAQIYQSVGQGDILSPKASVLLPFFLFSRWSSSAFSAKPLAKILVKRLPDQRLTQIAGMWPDKRVVVLATNFGNGRPAVFTNEDIAGNAARFREGVLASAISPLAAPPVYIRAGSTQAAAPHLDGGIHAVTPFQALFDLAARPQKIDLDRIVVLSAYPVFPGSDATPAQTRRFPPHPGFGDIGARMDALISESSITKEIGLAWAAIKLRSAGVSAEEVRKQTGLDIPAPPKEMILIAPDDRLGWDNLKFDRNEMQEMFQRGLHAKPRVLIP